MPPDDYMLDMADMPPAEMTEAPEPVVEAQGISTDSGHGHRYQSHSLVLVLVVLVVLVVTMLLIVTPDWSQIDSTVRIC